jgi:hypothetical protein
MRMTAQVSALVLAASLLAPARSARAQTPTATGAPFPYAPPPGFGGPDGGAPAVPGPQGPQVTEVPDATSRPAPPRPAALQPAELPPVEAGLDDTSAADAQAYPPDGQTDASYLDTDETIAEGYDDGYAPDAYGDFEQALAPYGSWVNDADYGEIWIPAVAIVGADFLPYYSNGHWVLSEYGWTWVSDWNWGWAPFHYGRWLRTAQRGWCWIPGTTWGPAWVSWRSGGGYVGWAPLPPRGVTFAAAISGYGPRSPWRFAPAASLLAARATGLPPARVPGIFGRTTVVANDRLLTHGPYAVHVNAGPVRVNAATPVRLATVAPRVLPRSAILPRPGVSVAARPWAHLGAPSPAAARNADERRGHGPAAPLGGRTAAVAPPGGERPRPYASFVSRSSAAPAWRPASTPAPTAAPSLAAPTAAPSRAAPTSPLAPSTSPARSASAAPAWRAPSATFPTRAAPAPVGNTAAASARYASPAPTRFTAPGPVVSEPRYGAPSQFAARAAPSGGTSAAMPVHVEPRAAPAPAPAPPPMVAPVHVAPAQHAGGGQPAFAPAPRASGWGGGSVGSTPRSGATFPARR